MTLPSPAAAEVARIVDFVMIQFPGSWSSEADWTLFRARVSTMLRTFGEDCLSGRFAGSTEPTEQDRKDAAGDAEREAGRVRHV